MSELAKAIGEYVRDTRALHGTAGTNEASYYPDIKTLVGAALKARHLPFDARVATSESRERGVDMPDFVLGDASFTGVFGEVKLADATLEQMAASQDRNDQIGRYLASTGVVLLSNIRGFGLLACRAGYARDRATPVPPAERELLATIDLWSSVTSGIIDAEAVERFADLIERSITDFAPLAAPSDLAKVLARQARDAKASLPEDLRPIGALLEDFAQALGLSFDLEDPKGDRFFRGSLIQTAFYSLFAGWVLWDRDPANASRPFSLVDAEEHLRIPFIQELFHDLRSPRYMRQLDLARHLERAVATLNRVDRSLFRQAMTFPTTEDDAPSISTITYFYEPFLEAFDPELRDELGVWYTPPEIVRYQVRRVHHLLKAELGMPRGLASRDVVVLDPCCGTGAYLLEVARCVAEELRADGGSDTLAIELLEALTHRIIGFEILTAPFAVAQLQLYVLLADLGITLPDNARLAVYLTNALTGWSDERDVKITFPEMRDEFDASQSVKRDAQVIVVLGNPPYDRFTGAAQAEEADLVAAYKGVRLQTQYTDGNIILRDRLGNPVKKQIGKSELYSVWGVRKQLLDDLYIRFFRMAEERIGISASKGIVSYISNSSWLTGRSHPMMRQSIVRNFREIWIDNLNGDKFKTGKIIPKDLPGAGTRDDSAFTTPLDPRGIMPGTAIATMLKRTGETGASTEAPTVVHYRDLWGVAAGKRQHLLESLPAGEPRAGSEAPRYIDFEPEIGMRWRLAPVDSEGGYEAWPALDELFPERPQGVNPNRGLDGSLVDTSKAALQQRMKAYLEAPSFAAAEAAAPILATKRARYDPQSVRDKLVSGGGYAASKVIPYLAFPFDQRWIYYDPRFKLLNEARSELGDIVADNEFLITVPEPRKLSEALPAYSRALVNLHVQERGCVAIPREVEGEGLFAGRIANIAEPVWTALRDHFGYDGRRETDQARTFVGDLFRVILALMHAPAYQFDHKSALGADWAHVPLPRDKALFDALKVAGGQLVALLDIESDASEAIRNLLAGSASTIGVLRRVDGRQVQPADLLLSVSYWGGAKGKWLRRASTVDDNLVAALGEETGDLYINDDTAFFNVPVSAWFFQVGGYPTLKKWLGYRQASRRDGAPLTLEEARSFRDIIQRLSAIAVLHDQLDTLYNKAAVDGFLASDLGIVR